MGIEHGKADRHTTADIIVRFAQYGISIETIARAMARPTLQVEATCRRAIECGAMQMMPPQTPADARSPLLVELVHLRAQLSDAQALLRERNEPATAMGLAGIARLTPNESKIAGFLAARGRVSKAQLFHHLFGHRLADDQPEPKIIDVFICKVRAKLKPHGIEIKTIWGSGYEMTPGNVAKLRALQAPYIESPSLAPAAA